MVEFEISEIYNTLYTFWLNSILFEGFEKQSHNAVLLNTFNTALEPCYINKEN